MEEGQNYINIISKLAVEYWKLFRSYERIMTTMPPDNKLLSVARNAERRLHSILSEANLVTISYEGQQYSPNLALSAINADEFEGISSLVIAQMIEPTIMHRDIVVSVGKALLGLGK